MVIEALVLQSERLMYIPIDALILFQTTPAGVVTKPNQIAVLIGHLSRDTEVAVEEVEVVGLLSVFSVFVDVV